MPFRLSLGQSDWVGLSLGLKAGRQVMTHLMDHPWPSQHLPAELERKMKDGRLKNPFNILSTRRYFKQCFKSIDSSVVFGPH